LEPVAKKVFEVHPEQVVESVVEQVLEELFG